MLERNRESESGTGSLGLNHMEVMLNGEPHALPTPLTVDYLRIAVSRHSPLATRMAEIDAALQRRVDDGSIARWLDASEAGYRVMLGGGVPR